MKSLHANSIFTNVALTKDGDIYWEEMFDKEPDSLTDWIRRPWTPDSGRPSAHPNARFTAPAKQCPVIADEWQDPTGVPISAILVGGRRGSTVPLATESFTWQHGTFLASIMSSEKTAAAAGKVGELRYDPMAMLPFCGYNMGDYFNHWLKVGATDGAKMPKVYYTNWFRKDENGKFMWPGYGENSRVLKWVFERCDGTADAKETPIGNLPTVDALDTDGLDLPAATLEKLLTVDVDAYKSELAGLKEHYDKFGKNLPDGLRQELKDLENRLNEAS
jgi:phosphoenolpyruvate carboxykinase (GTP)